MDLSQVFDRFMLITGLDFSEASPYMVLCSEALADISRRLKKGVDTSKQGDRLAAAAASLAYYKYALMSSASQGTASFSAAGVKISPNSEKSTLLAKHVRDDALADIADLLEDTEFVVRQVP